MGQTKCNLSVTFRGYSKNLVQNAKKVHASVVLMVIDNGHVPKQL